MRAGLIGIVLLAAGCSGQSPADKAAQDARDIAQVEAAQDVHAPPRPVNPQPILFFDITKAKLYGSGCNFVSADGGMGALLLAQTERGVIKLNDKLVILAADKGSKALPQGAWSHYTGKEYALTLSRIEDGKAVKNGVVELFDGQVVITDPHDNVVYNAKGNVQCKPM